MGTHVYRIQLETMSDIREFVETVSTIDQNIKLCDGNDFCVNAKSLLGAMASIEWKELYCVCSEPIYTKIEKFCVT